jgi:hypothetical protein
MFGVVSAQSKTDTIYDFDVNVSDLSIADHPAERD